MKNLNNKGSVFIYILILVIITMFLWTIIFDSNSSLTNERKVENIENILINNIFYNWRLAIKYDKLLNSNWTWFVDSIACPKYVDSFNQKIHIEGDSKKQYNDWTQLIAPTNHSWAYCSWTYTPHTYFWVCPPPLPWVPSCHEWIVNWSSNPFSILFKNDYSDFSWASYLWEKVALSWNYHAQFHDSDNTKMDFINSPWSDNIDDNFNSDNYKVTSTWNIYYPKDANWNIFADDDIKARKIVYWYITPENWYLNVFWSNSKFSKIIDDNINNNDNINIKIWNVSSWTLRFDVDEAVDLRIVEFDKNRFNATWELSSIKTYEKTLTWWIAWYLQLVSQQLDFSDNHTANDFIFDFKNNDYAIFMKNRSAVWATIFYRITWEEKNTGSWIYLVPIDDTDNNLIKYYWWSIIKKDADYIYKMEEVYGEK